MVKARPCRRRRRVGNRPSGEQAVAAAAPLGLKLRAGDGGVAAPCPFSDMLQPCGQSEPWLRLSKTLQPRHQPEFAGRLTACRSVPGSAPCRSLQGRRKHRLWEPALRDPPPLLADVCVVLVSPKRPISVGTVARSLSCFECEDLRIVQPRCDHLARSSRNGSKGAQWLLWKAAQHASLAEALADVDLAVACTRWVAGARGRGPRACVAVTLWEAWRLAWHPPAASRSVVHADCARVAFPRRRCKAARAAGLPDLPSPLSLCMQGVQTPFAACPSCWRTRKWQRCWQHLLQAAAASAARATMTAAVAALLAAVQAAAAVIAAAAAAARASSSCQQSGQSWLLCLAGRLKGSSPQRLMPATSRSAFL